MEELNVFVMRALRACSKTTHNKELWMHQAFGAIQYHVTVFPEDYEEVSAYWAKMKPLFEREIYGIVLRV